MPHRLNLPNVLTLIRMPLTFAIVALMYGTWPWAATLACGLFVGAAVTDWLDGKLARERNIVSDFGKFMDALADKVLVLGVMAALLDLNYLEPVPAVIVMLMVLTVLTREFMISGLRMMAAMRGVVMAAERGGKIKTIIQMTSLGFLLAAPMLTRDFSRVLPIPLERLAWLVHWIGLALFFLSMWFMVSSMATYYRKYRHVLFDVPAA
ncbi:MAG TPA: CDP-diacylglycerol--glycerol-3-phosphate 3-phosphatidyltransferase [Opitutaceae bacterium]|nr:CDP-diacylglycerol--glycerol-3-phosphate 3-phosphatidyltransferase [Opitutaceae bacterium]